MPFKVTSLPLLAPRAECASGEQSVHEGLRRVPMLPVDGVTTEQPAVPMLVAIRLAVRDGLPMVKAKVHDVVPMKWAIAGHLVELPLSKNARHRLFPLPSQQANIRPKDQDQGIGNEC